MQSRRDAEKAEKRAIDELLALQEVDPEYYTDTVIKGIVLALLTAGTDTSALTTEWAMAELLTHPDAMQKLRAELDAVVGTTSLVEESDIANLPYLQCVVKEALPRGHGRLHRRRRRQRARWCSSTRGRSTGTPSSGTRRRSSGRTGSWTAAARRRCCRSGLAGGGAPGYTVLL